MVFAAVLFLGGSCFASASTGVQDLPGGGKKYVWRFTPPLDPADLPVLDLESVKGVPWRPGLSRRPVANGQSDPGVYPLFGFPLLQRREGESGRSLYFPLKGVWSGAELRDPIGVLPGSRWRFEVRLSSDGLTHSGFTIGVFWERNAKEALPLGELEPLCECGALLSGTHKDIRRSVEGRVPPGVQRARPFFFLRGDLRDLQGGVWVHEAAFSVTGGLRFRFDRRLLVFPPGDPIQWHLESKGLEVGTYWLRVGVESPDGGRGFGETTFQTLASRHEQLRGQGRLQKLFEGVTPIGGLYRVVCEVHGGASAVAEDRLVVQLARLGESGDTLGGELYQFAPSFSAREFLLLEKEGALEDFLSDIPVMTCRVEVSDQDFRRYAGALQRIVARQRQIQWIGLLRRRAVGGELEDIAEGLAALAEEVDTWEASPEEWTDREIKDLQELLRRHSMPAPLRWVSSATPRPWASSVARSAASPASDLRAAAWVELSAPPGRIVDQVLALREAGARCIVLPHAFSALFRRNPAGLSPTPTYGVWRTLQRVLGGPHFLTSRPPLPGAQAYWFRRGETEIVFVKALSPSGPLRLPAEGEVVVLDWWGNRTTLRPESGYVTVTPRRKWQILLGVAFGYKQTLDTVRCEGTAWEKGKPALRFTVTNLLGRPARLTMSEENGRMSVTVPLRAEGETTFSVPVPEELVKPLAAQGRLTAQLALQVDGRERHSVKRTFRIVWGTRRFSFQVEGGEAGTLSFSLRYRGKHALRANVFVLEESPQGPQVRWNWNGVSFQAGQQRSFTIHASQGQKPAEVVVLAPGGKAESFSLDTSRTSPQLGSRETSPPER